MAHQLQPPAHKYIPPLRIPLLTISRSDVEHGHITGTLPPLQVTSTTGARHPLDIPALAGGVVGGCIVRFTIGTVIPSWYATPDDKN